ncbi:hypothetical protein HBH82_023720 [Parastagonospora nodorum]|nr:hypothetical protein HBH82_023720 [Parastagonospora nodorum]KAH4708460.1 hypothetical protein HBH67_067950 [Parastagonospora nodorum]KAH4712909.1 hypothetical protein HBH78_040820 [Parastagonospora nodorum]KAH4781581.1 hypothetical protein HBH62_113190 [Parastagonospora nodorum]KAH4815049.1 hypothetical protein HBH63_045990 [Parastagonospora nodorum]
MAGEKKTADHTGRLHAKTGKKLLSKTSKPSSSAISSPPKAAIAAPNANRDEVHRRRNPLNDILRRRSGDEPTLDTAKSSVGQDAESKSAVQPSGQTAVDESMVDRVVELEKSLASATEERKALQRELLKARRISYEDQHMHDKPRQHKPDSPEAVANERGNAANIGENLSGANGDMEPLRQSPSPHDDIPRIYDSRYRLAQPQLQVASRDASHHDILGHPVSAGSDELNELRIRLHETERESQERLQQLLSLKSSVASLTRVESQVTDSDMTDALKQMFNRIREWVISNFRGTKMDVGSLPVETLKALRILTPAFETIEKTDRLALLQALVVDAMMPVLEEPLMVGLGRVGPLSAIRAFAEGIRNDSAEYCEWRRATIRVIEKSEMTISLEQGKSEALHKIAGEIAHVLFTLTSVSLAPAAQSGLRSILHTAAELQRTMALQKARYQVLFFRNQEGRQPCAFDDRRMEPLNDLDKMIGDDGDAVNEARFLFCVFPCLEKFGDEVGDHMDVSNVLLKGQVCCTFR